MRIVFLNAENLFITPKDHPSKHQLEKDPQKCRQLASAIFEIDAEFVWIVEVGGLESLQLFSKLYLDNKYQASLIPSNSDRGIDIGILSKRGLPYRMELCTNKNYDLPFNYPYEMAANEMATKIGQPLPFASHKLSRDFSELRLIRHGETKPFLIMLCVHLKSQLDSKGIDPRGFLRREAEVKLLRRVVRSLNKHFGIDVPVIFGGDFNGRANGDSMDPEFLALKKLPHKELADLLNLEHHDRITHVYFDKFDKKVEQQMDFCFVPPSLWNAIDHQNSGIYRWKAKSEGPLPIPQSQFQRHGLPSDHYPVVLSLNLKA